MASITACSLRAGKKVKDKQGSDQHLSKVVELNGKYRLFGRTVVIDDDGTMDAAAATVPGRSLNLDICGATFIAYDDTMYEMDDTGSITDKTGLDSWARISRVLHQAQCLREKKNAEAEVERSAQETGAPVDQVKLSRTLDGIDLKYNGGKAPDGTRINASVNPAISGIQQKMTTQLLVVKLLPDGKPDWEHAQYAVLEMSNQRVTELISILDNKDYYDGVKDYFEVGYDYIGTDKTAAGRAAKFQGIAASLSLEHQFPESWNTGKKLVDGLAKGRTVRETAEIIRSRNRNLKSTVSPAEVIISIKKYCANNVAIFGSINYEDETTERAAKDFLSNGLLDSLPVVKAKFEALVAEKDKDKEEEAPEKTETDEPTFEELEDSNLKAAAQVLDAGAEKQTLNQIMSAVPDIDLGDGDMGDLG